MGGWTVTARVILPCLLALVAGAVFPACEQPVDLFVACAEDGSCTDDLTCYRTDDILGYCTARCYSSNECPPTAVCYGGACVLICEEGGADCPGETTCYVVEGTRGICSYEAPE